jgi:hypothetical protein
MLPVSSKKGTCCILKPHASYAAETSRIPNTCGVDKEIATARTFRVFAMCRSRSGATSSESSDAEISKAKLGASTLPPKTIPSLLTPILARVDG